MLFKISSGICYWFLWSKLCFLLLYFNFLNNLLLVCRSSRKSKTESEKLFCPPIWQSRRKLRSDDTFSIGNLRLHWLLFSIYFGLQFQKQNNETINCILWVPSRWSYFQCNTLNYISWKLILTYNPCYLYAVTLF